jgi:phosphosulfolactate synthase (CoM biosynthesis protein A)
MPTIRGNSTHTFWRLTPARGRVGPARVRLGQPGLTMTLDWGQPNGYVEDLLRLAAAYIDIGKVAIGTARFYPEAYLREKVQIYQRHGVHPCPGGNLLEHAAAAGKVDEFLSAAAALGFQHVEVSNNRGRIPRSAIRPLIDKARASGFRVYGEVGSEVERTSFCVSVDGEMAQAAKTLPPQCGCVEAVRPQRPRADPQRPAS